MAPKYTMSTDAITTIRFPIRLLTLVCLLTIMAFAWFGWILFDSRRDGKMFADRLSRIEELRGVIIHLDEVLTMSARMAAATGDLQWEERYRRFEPQLDAAIKETTKIGTGSSDVKAATKIDGANIKLVEMESRAFALVRAGRKEGAQTLLFSPEYEIQKNIYAEETISFASQIRREFDESLRDYQRIDLFSIIAAVVVGGTSFMAWFSAARGVRRWRAQLLDSFNRRAEAEENLREAHAKLEVRVKERTADLANANEALQAENTERKRGEEALRASEAHLQTVVENLSEGVVVSGLNGKLLHWNRAALKIHGIANLEEGQRGLAELVDTFELSTMDGTRVRVEEWPLSRILRGDNLRDLELRVKNIKAGWQRIFNYGGTLVRDENNQPLLAIATITDITERKGGEEMLRSSEKRYRSLFESNPNPMWVYDVETLSFLAVNATAVEHYGYSQDEFLAMTIKDIRPDEDIPVLMDDLPERTGDAKNPIQWRHCRKDRTMIDVEITSQDLIWLGRRAKLVLINDITERKQAEERLREQADIINRAHDAIIVVSFEDQRITFWNSGAERLYGWSADDATGRSICELIFADEEDCEGLLKVLASAGEFHGEIKQVAKDGRKIIVHGRATLIQNPDGTPPSGLLINTDVTEQKKLETQLLRAQRLESIGTLASGVAHDLNNILTPILMCAEMLKDNPMGEDLLALVFMIEESAKRGANVVKQVLTFARGIEGEHVVIKPSHLIQEMIDIAQNTFPKTIEIRGRYTDELWSVKCDPTQLHQVLLNLSVNARDAMPNGGSIIIGAENFDVDEHYASMTPGAKPGPHVMFGVTDTGSGMSRAMIDKIFDPFFTTKEVGKGTGLGLSTVLGIVKSHDGFISVHSEVGKGTIFKIFLPADASVQSALSSETRGAPAEGNGELVLVVDDEENILRATKAVLEQHNYRVILASDGVEALAIFAQQKQAIRVVLTDIAMPYMDGVASVRALRKMKPDVPIIAFTGEAQQARLKGLQAMNVNSFLIKPFSAEDLLAAVHTSVGTGNSREVIERDSIHRVATSANAGISL